MPKAFKSSSHSSTRNSLYTRDSSITLQAVRPDTRNDTAAASLDSATRLSFALAPNTTCAFVPLKPNALTPASRSPPPPPPLSLHSIASSGITPPIDSITDVPMYSFSFSKCKCGTTPPCSMLSNVLITPKMPDAVSVCPKFVLPLPITNPRRPAPFPYACATACISIGSPSDVPVPCASSTLGRDPSLPLSPPSSPDMASRISRTCDGPFGAVSPLLRPSWLIALPRIPNSPSPSPFSSITAPHPSPRTYPLARASNVLQRPSGESIPALPKARKVSGVVKTFTPRHIASDETPRETFKNPSTMATSEDEHAVSIDIVFPVVPRTYASRPAAMLEAVPVLAKSFECA